VLRTREPLVLSSATVCRFAADGRVHRADLTAAQRDAVATGLRLEDYEFKAGSCASPYLALQAETNWGDRVMLSGPCGRFGQPVAASDRRGQEGYEHEWVATADLLHLLEAVTRR